MASESASGKLLLRDGETAIISIDSTGRATLVIVLTRAEISVLQNAFNSPAPVALTWGPAIRWHLGLRTLTAIDDTTIQTVPQEPEQTIPQ